MAVRDLRRMMVFIECLNKGPKDCLSGLHCAEDAFLFSAPHGSLVAWHLELARKCGLSSAFVTQPETRRIELAMRNARYCLARALGLEGDEVWKQAFTARLDRWLKKEGFKGPSPELRSALFDGLSKRE
jgi:hypothetical protein